MIILLVIPYSYMYRSGTEEDYMELHKLLQDIHSYSQDVIAIKAAATQEII